MPLKRVNLPKIGSRKFAQLPKFPIHSKGELKNHAPNKLFIDSRRKFFVHFSKRNINSMHSQQDKENNISNNKIKSTHLC